MQRFKYILAVATVVLIIGGGVIFGMLLKASGETEKKYQGTISSIENGDWENAYKIVCDIPNYKNAAVLSAYIYPHTLYYQNYGNEQDAIGGYTKALNYIRDHKNDFKPSGDTKYIAQLTELEKTLNFKVSELKARAENQIVTSDIDQCINLIKSGNYTTAQQKLASINIEEFNIEKGQLLEYINLQNAIQAKDNKGIMAAIAKLDPNYNGDLSGEIKTSVQAYADIVKWNSIYKPENNKSNGSSSYIAIGDQRSSVIQTLGKPVKQNIISNSYGVFEELVFNNNKLIYIENNIVTAVKG